MAAAAKLPQLLFFLLQHAVYAHVSLHFATVVSKLHSALLWNANDCHQLEVVLIQPRPCAIISLRGATTAT
jgi:hypothetical protein